MRPVLVSLAVLLAGCPPVVTREITSGDACWEAGEVTVAFAACLSSSCDTLVSADCTATLDGTELVVEATAVIESQGRVCTTDCGLVQATCDADVDPEGVTLVFDGTRTALSEARCDDLIF